MARQVKDYRPAIGRLRMAVQATSLLVFLYLTLAIAQQWPSPVPRDLLLRADPLLWAVGSVAGREIAPYAWLALSLVVATCLFGRVFCGWLCPLGTVIDASRAITFRRIPLPRSPGSLSIRFWILAALFGMALVGINLTSWLDPLVIAHRAVHAAVRFEVFGTSAMIAWTLAGATVLLTCFAPRFWCRTLCPLGTVLSLGARALWRGRRLSATCKDCGVCSTVCPSGQMPADESPGDCLVCRRCEAVCPQQAVCFVWLPLCRWSSNKAATPLELSDRERPDDPQRRRVLIGLLTGAGGISLGAVAGSGMRFGEQPTRIRPPGTRNEWQLSACCVGCGACMAVCPTGGLLPLMTLGRLDAVFTPHLVPRIGPCLPECTACGEVCPTNAIARLTVQDKMDQTIGTAEIDRDRCLPWASGERCVICVDACPGEFQAIELRAVQPRKFRPFVDPARCTGCGICEYRCPVDGPAAIRIRPPIRISSHHLSNEGQVLPNSRPASAS